MCYIFIFYSWVESPAFTIISPLKTTHNITTVYNFINVTLPLKHCKNRACIRIRKRAILETKKTVKKASDSGQGTQLSPSVCEYKYKPWKNDSHIHTIYTHSRACVWCLASLSKPWLKHTVHIQLAFQHYYMHM